MELRHLRSFIAVAETGHITEAAERLGTHQPPLSRLIAGMERKLGARLFVRKPRGVELTEAGEAFLAGARTVVADLDLAIERTRGTARGERGRLRIGITATSGFNPFVARSIRSFSLSHPQVTIGCEEQMSAQLVERLRTGQLDAAFLWSPPAEGITVHPLLDDPLVVALSREHTLAAAADRPLDIASLADAPFAVYGRRDGFGLYAATITACQAAGFAPRFTHEAQRLSAALNLVAAGLCVCLVPASTRAVSIDGVVFRRLSGAVRPSVPLSLATRRTEHSQAAKRFRTHVKRMARPGR